MLRVIARDYKGLRIYSAPRQSRVVAFLRFLKPDTWTLEARETEHGNYETLLRVVDGIPEEISERLTGYAEIKRWFKWEYRKEITK